MSFKPTYPRYINFNTASYISPSSSIGPTGLDTLVSNQEWLYHNVNSQVLINSKNTSFVSGTVISGNQSTNIPIFVKNYGPVKLNLNKAGLPQPMFLAFKGGNLQVFGLSQGYFTFVFNSQGTTNLSTGWLNLTSSIQSFFSQSYQTLSGSYQDSEEGGTFFSSTASVSSTPNNALSVLSNKTDKAGTNINTTQLSCMINVSIYWTQTSASSVNAWSMPRIDGLYLREVNPYKT